MRNKIIQILFFIFLITFNQTIFSQNRSVTELKKQRREIQKLINLTDKQLRKTKQKEKNILKKINVLEGNLTARKELIKNYNKEINLVQRKINKLENEQKELEIKLKGLKKDYAKLIQSTQIQQNKYSKLLFLLSAETFYQTWRRLRYLREFTDYKQEQLLEIKAVQEELSNKSDTLNFNKKGLKKLLKTKRIEHNKLYLTQKREKTFLTSIRKKEKKLSKEFQNQVSKRAVIDRRIEKIIKEEIRKEAKRKRIKKRNQRKSKVSKRPIKSVKPTIHDTKLSKNFAQNRGRLPWPVSRGYISKRFGKHKHSTFRNVTINNKSTYFKASKGATARAVFEGVVTRRFSLPGSGNAVILQHGKYRTVYGNLTKIYVNVGDKLKVNQPIGMIYVDEEKGYAELLFQIWKGTILQNPELWIRR